MSGIVPWQPAIPALKRSMAMKKMTCAWMMLGMLACVFAAAQPAFAAEKAAPKKRPPVVYPAAILSFHERGAGVKGYGATVADLLFASLVANENIYLVDRADMTKVLKELELNLSGMVKPDEATKIGQLTGAKIIVTGTVIQAGKTIYIVAKIIGTETSRVLGESVKGKVRDEIGPLVEQLGKKVAATIIEKSGKLVAKEVKTADRIAALKKKLGDAERPSVIVKISERHVGQATIDPAAETEITLFCKDSGFDVIDPAAGMEKQADIIIKGEGFSEFAGRRGNLISVKARVEVKAVDRVTGRVVAVDRQTAVAVDLVEQIAGKAALQKAAATIAERMLPKLVTKNEDKRK